jgi:hypothetical protein
VIPVDSGHFEAASVVILSLVDVDVGVVLAERVELVHIPVIFLRATYLHFDDTKAEFPSLDYSLVKTVHLHSL